MHIERLVLGLYETNCYVVGKDDKSLEVVIVDTGLDTSAIADYLREHQLKPAALILTHGHADHIVGAAAVRAEWPNVKVYIHRLDAQMLTDAGTNLSTMSGGAFVTDPAEVIVEQGDVIKEAGIELEVIHTPGHTPGGICLYAKQERILFSGDTLFADSIGRTDFPGGSMEQLVSGIKEKLLALPDDTAVHPGHASRTTIGRERRLNPFIR